MEKALTNMRFRCELSKGHFNALSHCSLSSAYDTSNTVLFGFLQEYLIGALVCSEITTPDKNRVIFHQWQH